MCYPMKPIRKRKSTSATTVLTLAAALSVAATTFSAPTAVQGFVPQVGSLVVKKKKASTTSSEITDGVDSLLLLKHHRPLHSSSSSSSRSSSSSSSSSVLRMMSQHNANSSDGTSTSLLPNLWNKAMSTVATVFLATTIMATSTSQAAFAENELSAKYGGKGFDTSLVDQTCLVNHCSIQAKSCLQDDTDCRKGLTCTAKCLGDNACITGCMARYGNANLDNLLKCTIEDHECIKIAILDGGADPFGQEPLAPVPVVKNFDIASLEGSWYKVIGYNPNYDCYACQRNSFTAAPDGDKQKLRMDVEFSMPHLLPDGSPLPPTSSTRESAVLLVSNEEAQANPKLQSTMKSIGLNDYSTHETMIFDQGYNSKDYKSLQKTVGNLLTLNKGTDHEVSYQRTAHSEGEMFGLKFWENWYIIGENDKDSPEEFKFVFYNGKTRQNTYEGAFIYSRTKELSPASMRKVYQIAESAGMNPNQFCRIRNGCFADEPSMMMPNSYNMMTPQEDFFRGILASTRISQLLGVEPVAARDTIRRNVPTASILTPQMEGDDDTTMSSSASGKMLNNKRQWWYEVGDYLENPHRHFQAMDQLRLPMEWPEDVVSGNSRK